MTLGAGVWKIPYHDIEASNVVESNISTSSVNIIAGNTDNRFYVSEDNTSVLLAGLLNADILSNYNLILHFISEAGTVFPIRLVIWLDNVNGWPPYYNETCATDKLATGLISPSIIMGSWSGGPEVGWKESDVIYTNFNNSLCEFEIYLAVDQTVSGLDTLNLTAQILEDGKDTGALTIEVFKEVDTERIEPEAVRIWRKLQKENDESYLGLIAAHHGFDTSRGRSKLTAIIVSKADGSMLFKGAFEMHIKGCPEGRFGCFCQYDCVCKNGAVCHAWNGACKCKKDWQGPACDIAVEPYADLTSIEGTSVPLHEMLNFECKSNLRRVDVIWMHNGKVYNDSAPPEMYSINSSARSGRLYIRRVTKQDSGVYQCVFISEGARLVSNTVNITVNGCKYNVWGENCELTCDCVHALECSQYKGCVCHDGWNGQHCQLDIQPPEVHNCPMDIIVERDDGMNTTMVDWNMIEATDNAGIPSVYSNYNPGDVFEIGTTTVIYNISDGTNSVECTFTVTILDLQKEKPWLIIGIPIGIGVVIIFAAILTFQCKRRRKHRIRYDPLEMVYLALPDDVPRIPCEDLTILQFIGEGQFSIVRFGKLIEEQGQLRDVAVKILRDQSHECLFAFQEEVTSLDYLKGHPNIIQLIGVVLKKDAKYIISELMSADLLDYLGEIGRKAKIHFDTDQRLVKIALDVTRAMAYMEHMKVVHRDIAARNILISYNGVAKVGDFGLARDVYQTGEYRRHRGRPGRFPTKWMAPESLTEDIYTYKTDIWSYGVLLWEIASLVPCQYM
ncbi:uncharacterized protein LOC144436248 isoform X2 [Glandiceps talaboti]